MRVVLSDSGWNNYFNRTLATQPDNREEKAAVKKEELEEEKADPKE